MSKNQKALASISRIMNKHLWQVCTSKYKSVTKSHELLIWTNLLPSWLSGKEDTSQSRRCWFDPWVGKIPWRRKMATHSSTLAWRIPWTEGSSGLQSMGSQRVGHDLATKQQLIQATKWATRKWKCTLAGYSYFQLKLRSALHWVLVGRLSVDSNRLYQVNNCKKLPYRPVVFHRVINVWGLA